MRAHYLQHVPFEGLGSIETWLRARGARISDTQLYDGARLPDLDGIDWVIAMGGPMSVNDEAQLPWLVAEKRFVADAIARGKVVLGICLGAQLIANALGAAVARNRQPEIGWFPITRVAAAGTHPLAAVFPSEVEVFHWHGETFDLPPGAVHLARSAACEHQAFALGDRVVGLQFHLETTPASAAALAEHCADELRPAPYVQSAAEMLARPERFARINTLMAALLDHLASQ